MAELLVADPTRPLSALLSQTLVAFTVELDNEFELRMGRAGYAGARFSLLLWFNLLRFVPASGITMRSLGEQTLTERTALKFMLGCLERWGAVALIPAGATAPRFGKQAGWGSGRGILSSWTVVPAPRGLAAQKIWQPLVAEIEQRWVKRFGVDEIARLRAALTCIVGALEMELPHGFVDLRERKAQFPRRTSAHARDLSLPALLAQVLTAFALEFEPKSVAPMALSANTLRVLADGPIPEREIPRLTGGSPETAGIGWQIKPFIVVEPAPAGERGKQLRLSPRGLFALHQYRTLTAGIEQDWHVRFGRKTVEALRKSLLTLFDRESSDDLTFLMAEGLVPPAGTVRAGDQAPALGRRDIGVAARQRARDLEVQTAAFLENPAAALPHYPLWDMNRGFGP